MWYKRVKILTSGIPIVQLGGSASSYKLRMNLDSEHTASCHVKYCGTPNIFILDHGKNETQYITR